jgi:prolyl-tRNA editing enzyme YbaK/EbsC (Cys-tRNA(Pro) deacylase)
MSRPGLQKFAAALLDLGLECPVRTLPDTTRTAADAAAAIGCSQSQIAKSIIFRSRAGDTPVLAVVCGTNRVSVEKLAAVFGDTLSKAGADFVKSATGYAIGGVPPFGHTQIIKTCLDDALFEFTTVWAAAGDSNSVFEVETEKLLAATLGIQADIKA